MTTEIKLGEATSSKFKEFGTPIKSGKT